MLSRLSIKVRLAIVVLIGVAGLVALGAYETLKMRHEMIAESEARLQTVTALALSIAEARHAQAEAGEISEAEARTLAAREIAELRYDGSNYLWVNDLDGLLVAHPHRAEQIGTSMLGLTDRNGTQIYREFVAAARQGGGFVGYVGRRPGAESDDLTSPKLAHIASFAPWDWAIGTGSYIDDIDARFWAQVRLNALIVLAAVSLSVVIAALVSRSITKGIAGITAAMGRLAAGQTDVSVPYKGYRNEIGVMADAVDIFRANAIEKQALEARQTEAERRAAQEKRAEMQRLAEDFRGTVGQVIASLSTAAGELQTAAESLEGVAAEANDEAGIVATASQDASGNVRTVASAAEELGQSIGEISRQMAVQGSTAEQAVAAATGSEQKIRDLAEKVEAIGGVVSLITSIAEQTNLLALNATIEAARAGDAGKGFAVVAAEVKALATQTGNATEEIAAQIKAIQDQTSGVVEAIADIQGRIGEIKGVTATVASAVEEQNAASAEIGRNIQEAAEGTSQVSSAIVLVKAAAGRAGEGAGRVRSSSEGLTGQAEELSQQVTAFLGRIAS
jgi:methyl-accepting chemotaxis protein